MIATNTTYDSAREVRRIRGAKVHAANTHLAGAARASSESKLVLLSKAESKLTNFVTDMLAIAETVGLTACDENAHHYRDFLDHQIDKKTDLHHFKTYIKYIFDRLPEECREHLLSVHRNVIEYQK